MFAPLSVLLLLGASFIAVALASSETCAPTASQQVAGPLYVPNAPRKKTICDALPIQPTLRILAENATTCGGTYCGGTRIERPARRIRVRGIVRDAKCRPIRGAQVDVWQPSPDGRYGSARPSVGEQGFCRAVAETGADGVYDFETYEPGSYGLFTGFLPVIGDMPPWVPRHIHFIVFAPTYEPIVTQLYFEADPAVDYDFRAGLANTTLGADNKALRMHFAPCTDAPGLDCSTMDFVLTPATSEISLSFTTLEAAAYHWNCVLAPWSPGRPYPLCDPWAIEYLRADAVFPVLALILLLAMYAGIKLVSAICRAVFGGTKPSPKSHKKKSQ